MTSLMRLPYYHHHTFNTIVRLPNSVRHAHSDLPRKMRAWQIYRYGKNDALTLGTNAAVPVVRHTEEVLIRVHAASVNALDVRMRGGYGAKMMNILRSQQSTLSSGSEFPLTLGRDCSGTVLETGRDVTRFKPGDEVWCVISPFRQGSHADYVIASQSEMDHKPPELSFTEAAAFPYVTVTSWSALCTVGGFNVTKAKNKRVLVYGAAGGIGTLVIQLLRAWGAEVTAVCGTDGVDLVTKLGASHVIDYKCDNVMDKLKSMKNFDLAIDAVGTDDTRSSALAVLRPFSDSKYINVVTPLLRNADDYGTALGMAKSILDLGASLTEGLTRGIGVRWAYFIPNGRVLTTIKDLIVQKKIEPVIDEVYKFEELPRAYEKMEQGRHRGKIVIQMIDDPAR